MATELATPPAVLKQPLEAERITKDEYTIRVELNKELRGDVDKVELYIDRGAPLLCTGALGYYWHDWSHYQSGDHQIVAMVKTRRGKIVTVGPCRFAVDIGRESPESYY